MENNSITIQKNEQISFYQLFKTYNLQINIPIIQREYAQGRDSIAVEEVRTQFLESIYAYLESKNPFHNLDFIYGTIENNTFIPLDGQQRLTTLFLLHRYLYYISDNAELKNEYQHTVVKNRKSLFSYKTRQSAEDFCDALMNNEIEIDVCIKLSTIIRNKNWFFRSWEFDPTIRGMLVMLDAIHKKFKGKQQYFARLLDTEKPAITFLFMDLNKFRLTDDLYIKMNSRGKQLTPFENFKAQYFNYLKTEDIKQLFKFSFQGKEREFTVDNYFLHSIDTNWTDMIWAYRNIDDKNNINYNKFDQKLAYFIQTIFIYYYTEASDKITNELLKKLKELQERKEQNAPLIFSIYKKNEVLNEKSALFLINSFDILYKYIGTSGKLKLLPEGHPFDEDKAFQNCLRNSFTYAQQLCFYAYLKFLIQFKDKNPCAGLADWMRIIYNLSHPDNTPTNSIEDFVAAIKSIRTLLKGLSDPAQVLQYFTANNKISHFSSWQVKEEKIKALLLLRDEKSAEKKWRNAIEQTEKHDYFTGQIGFILSFSGIVEYYNSHDNCDWNENEDESFFEQFKTYAEKACSIFTVKVKKDDPNFCFERAVLTKGDYLIGTTAGRKNLLSTNTKLRDYSWRRLLRLEDTIHQEKQKYVKEVFDDEHFNSLEDICKNGAIYPNEESTDKMWRTVLINHPQCFKYAERGFLYFSENDCIWLLSRSQRNSYHVELYSYALYMNELNAFKNNKGYEPSRDLETPPYIWLEIQHEKSVYYLFILTVELKEYDLEKYCVQFQNENQKKAKDEYPQDILELMENTGLNWNDDEKLFEKKVKPHLIIKLLHKIYTELQISYL